MALPCMDEQCREAPFIEECNFQHFGSAKSSANTRKRHFQKIQSYLHKKLNISCQAIYQILMCRQLLLTRMFKFLYAVY